MRRSLAFALLALLACEPRAPEPASTQPAQPTAPAPTPASPAPRPEPEPEPEPEDLPAVAGVHYLELVTGGADPNDELVMIVAIHGLGDQPENFAGLLRDFDRPARVILPRALDPHEPGWSWFPIRARDPDVEGLSAGIERAADTLAPAIAELTKLRPTKGKPIVTGFSQGGMLGFTLAVRHGELLAAAFPVGGWLPPPLWPSAGDPSVSAGARPPIHAFHGDEDKAVKLEPTEAAVAELRKAGYAVELDVYPGVGHAIPPQMHAELLAALAATVDEIASE